MVRILFNGLDGELLQTRRPAILLLWQFIERSPSIEQTILALIGTDLFGG
ncbi:MAG: hypothetical protein P1P76_04140 [Anaerolineales bacterium]|nr:hypothetical protein [Anaerolineales bacterium]